ncbi:MAG: hypothetical protein IT222_10425 [Crocinitomix sp.]|nr:hypothetical protein [Crocinitomix sp.]
MVLLSITGVVRTIFIIIGVIFFLRFLGRLMISKRAMDEERRMLRQQRQSEREIQQARANYGKRTISKIDPNQTSNNDYVDFEEVTD